MRSLSNSQKRISYLLKIIVFVSAVVGTFLSAYAGRHSFMGGSRVFMYFTIQSNIAVAIISLIGCFKISSKKEISRLWQVIKFVGTVAITLTGIVFCFVLAPTLGQAAWNAQNVLTHVVVPITSVVDFFVVSHVGSLKKKDVIYVI
ncbi:Pr6Pr family membrane protein [Lachnospira multipara]|uniref:Uncharacterized protein n=1 Tax=Lachnospira multipara TaxID=28051 RepID=A0A1H5TU76_9FIRM|nr:Pr6Pr family membrane protein [Lachnospira multipara]SEF66344.1 hypothetical protein SAMN05216537_105126 [Lachnospira multipara]